MQCTHTTNVARFQSVCPEPAALTCVYFCQVMVWGDYGRIGEKKEFMGVAQVNLDDVDLSHIVFGWYKLFSTTAMVGVAPTRRNSQSSTGSTPR